MNLKTVLFATLIASLVAVQAHAAAIFPHVADPGEYDGVVDDFRFSVTGSFNDNNANGDFDTGDRVSLLFKPTTVDGLPVSANFAYAIIADAGTLNQGAFYNLAPIAGGLSSIFTNVNGAIDPSALGVALGSETFDFSSITDPAGLNDSAVNAEFSLINDGFDDVTRLAGTFDGVDETVFSLNFRSTVAANNLTNTSFIPLSLTTLFPTTTSFFDVRIRTDGTSSLVFAADLLSPQAPNQYGVTGLSRGTVNPIPEPASMLTLLGCVTGACVMGRRRRKALAAA